MRALPAPDRVGVGCVFRDDFVSHSATPAGAVAERDVRAGTGTSFPVDGSTSGQVSRLRRQARERVRLGCAELPHQKRAPGQGLRNRDHIASADSVVSLRPPWSGGRAGWRLPARVGPTGARVPAGVPTRAAVGWRGGALATTVTRRATPHQDRSPRRMRLRSPCGARQGRVLACAGRRRLPRPVLREHVGALRAAGLLG
jgi:hypothetical protein